MKKKKIICTCVFVIIALMCSFFSGALPAGEEAEKPFPKQKYVDGDTDPSDLINYEKITENNNLTLYADMTKGLFALQNNKSGYIWYSTPNNTLGDEYTKGVSRMEMMSQIAIGYVRRQEEAFTTTAKYAYSQSECVSEGNVAVKAVTNGIEVTYFFKSQGITVTVLYTLTDTYFEASVLLDKIDEGSDYFLTEVQLLPTFGAGSFEDEGYLFVPDGCGAIVDFSVHRIMSGFNGLPVYSEEKTSVITEKKPNIQSVKLPVFGTVIADDNALMGIITEGDGAASIQLKYRSESCGYTAICAQADYRTIGSKELLSTTGGDNYVSKVSRIKMQSPHFTVRYSVLSGQNASYSGMASAYREYLINEKGLKQQVSEPSMNIELYAMADITSSFLGFQYTNMQKLTTFEQAERIVKAFYDAGVKSLSLRLNGWTNNGISNNKAVKNAKPLTSLGGRKYFDSLKVTLKNNNSNFYPDIDLIHYRSSGNSVSVKKNSARTVFGDAAGQYRFSPSVYTKIIDEKPVYLLSGGKLSDISNRFLSDFKKTGNTALGLGPLGNYAYSDLDEKTGAYKDKFLKTVESVLKSYADAGFYIGADSANAYALPYIDRIWNAPLYSSGYDIYKTDVPFYQMVLHGNINMTTPAVHQSLDPVITILKAAETGIEPLYTGIYEHASKLTNSRYDYLYSSTYTLWQDEAVLEYRKLEPILKKVYNKKIISHKELFDGVFCTEYENGVRVAVNYNTSSTILENGQSCEGLSFIEIGGEAE